MLHTKNCCIFKTELKPLTIETAANCRLSFNYTTGVQDHATTSFHPTQELSPAEYRMCVRYGAASCQLVTSMNSARHILQSLKMVTSEKPVTMHLIKTFALKSNHFCSSLLYCIDCSVLFEYLALVFSALIESYLACVCKAEDLLLLL